MATAASRPNMKSVKEVIFEWEGKDRNGKIVRGELRAAGEHQVQATLRRQSIADSKCAVVCAAKFHRAGF